MSMVDQPKITVVIPAYNAAATLRAAMNSVLGQRGGPLELVVVDDGSLDGTKSVAEGIAACDQRVVVLSQPNGGTASALNAGIAAAHGEYVAALGADDELAADYMSTMLDFMNRHPGYDIYSHDMWAVTPSGDRSRVLGWSDVRSVTLDQLLAECVILGGGTLVRRALLLRLGYRQDMYNEDYDLWLRALAGGATHIYAPHPLYVYNLRPSEQKTAQRAAMYQSAIAMFEDLLTRHELTPDQRATADMTIGRFRSYMEETETYGGQTEGQVIADFAEGERVALRRAMARVLPGARVDGALAVVYRFAWLVRPIRRLIWKVRLALRRR